MVQAPGVEDRPMRPMRIGDIVKGKGREGKGTVCLEFLLRKVLEKIAMRVVVVAAGT